MNLESELKCALNFNLILTNDTTLPYSDAVIYGAQYFQRYSSLQIDFDNMKIAFSGGDVPSHFESGVNGGTIALIIILVVVGVALIAAGVWWYLRRKNLPNHLNRYDQL